MLTLPPGNIDPIVENTVGEGGNIEKDPVSKPGRSARSAADLKSETVRSTVSASAGTYGSRAGGVAIATCCHHACSWRDYVGQEFLLELVSGGLQG